MSHWKKGLVLGLVVLTALGLVGCQSDTKQKAEEGTNKVLKIGTEPTYVPLEYTDEKGNYKGFELDVARAVAKAIGRTPEIQSISFDGLIPALQTGKIDMIASGMVKTDEREKKINFIPYFASGLSIVVNQNNTSIHNIDDLKGKRIAVQLGSTGADVAHSIEGAQVRDFDRTPDALLELKQGGADAVIMGTVVAQYYLATTKDSESKMIEEPIRTQTISLGFRKDDEALKKEVEEGLKKIKETGEYQQIYEQYFGKQE